MRKTPHSGSHRLVSGLAAVLLMAAVPDVSAQSTTAAPTTPPTTTTSAGTATLMCRSAGAGTCRNGRLGKPVWPRGG